MNRLRGIIEKLTRHNDEAAPGPPGCPVLMSTADLYRCWVLGREQQHSEAEAEILRRLIAAGPEGVTQDDRESCIASGRAIIARLRGTSVWSSVLPPAGDKRPYRFLFTSS